MKASVSDQRSILDIQKFDNQAATLANKAANLPELAEITSTTIKQNNVRDLRIAAETELSDVKRELARAEGDVEQIVTRIERDEKRLASGTGTPKELEQTQHELGTLGARRAELEEVELEIMMRVDAINERITALKAEEAEHAVVIADLEIRKEMRWPLFIATWMRLQRIELKQFRELKKLWLIFTKRLEKQLVAQELRRFLQAHVWVAIFQLTPSN